MDGHDDGCRLRQRLGHVCEHANLCRPSSETCLLLQLGLADRHQGGDGSEGRQELHLGVEISGEQSSPAVRVRGIAKQEATKVLGAPTGA